MLDCGRKIPVSTGDVIELTPQHSGCYFLLSGDIDGSITFDRANLADDILFNFNVYLKDITSAGALEFVFKNGNTNIVIGSYENIENEVEITPGSVYCFACTILKEGMSGGVPVYSAAVNLAYIAAPLSD